jgi:hypothetical protein
MTKQTNAAKPAAVPAAGWKKTLKRMFEERDCTLPGSSQEQQATEKILKAVFPDTSAD